MADTTPEQLAKIEQQFRANLNKQGSALNKAKTDYLASAGAQLSQTPEYSDPKVLALKLAELNQQFDERVIATAKEGAQKGGKPAVYTQANPNMADKLAAPLGQRLLSHVPIIGGLLADFNDMMGGLIDFGGIMDWLKEKAGFAPTYNADQKAMAGALDALEKTPISFGVGDTFVLDRQTAARTYDQTSSSTPTAQVAQNSAPITLTPDQKAEAERVKLQMAQSNATTLQDHSGTFNPGTVPGAGAGIVRNS